VAISNEGRTELAKAIANYGSEKLAFPLLSNAEMDVFKQYRCYDDFEGQPLHGTFLIDPQGRDVWHDIGFEPFMDAKFVLREALRRRQLHEHGAF
jgi:peroxiredoxin